MMCALPVALNASRTSAEMPVSTPSRIPVSRDASGSGMAPAMRACARLLTAKSAPSNGLP